MNFERIQETACCAADIKPGDKIPIGGSFPGQYDLFVTVDFDKFSKFFDTVKKNAINLQNNQSMKKWLDDRQINFKFETFAHLYAFDNVLRKMYPNITSNTDTRKKFYNPNKTAYLSDAVSAGICQCAEIAILTQIYLQQQNFDTKFFSGEILQSDGQEFGEPHSFIILKQNTEQYIYDPANPLRTNQEICIPRIQFINANNLKRFYEVINKPISNNSRNCAYVETVCPFNNQKLYYGVGDGMNVFEKFIIKSQQEYIQQNSMGRE